MCIRDRIATAPTISDATHPRDKSLTGFAIPCVIGPNACAPPNLCTNLYPMLPASKSGNTNTFALPATSLLEMCIRDRHYDVQSLTALSFL